MRAALRSQYGSADVIHVGEHPRPEPRKDEVLIRVHAATVSRTDIGLLRGAPYAIRTTSGWLRPKVGITGSDFAGVVEAVGDAVQQFQPGDRVWGYDDNAQSHAEYLCMAERGVLLPIPAPFSFAQAAASAEAAFYAWNFINKVKLGPGMRVLVNGGTGAIGSAAIQMLKALGAEVTATAATPHLERVKALGAVRVIDYTREDFTRDLQTYPLVFDAVGKSRFTWCKKLLDPGGVYISSELGPRWENIWLALLTPLGGGRKVIFPLPLRHKETLQRISAMALRGEFAPLIDRHYPLDAIREAYAYVETGQKIGNVILDLA